MTIRLPIYQHPVLVVLIDDNQSYMESVTFQLDTKLAFKMFTDTEAAINWISSACQYYQAGATHPIHVGYDDETSSLERRNAAIDLNEIYCAVLNRLRFTLPAIVVVDYAMPKMHGVKLCELLGNLPCKKILLTGQADEKIAVNAFNDKLIDQFIRKNDPSAPQKLEHAIHALRTAFFTEQTSTLKDLLTRHTYAFLADAAIAALVEDIYEEYGFVEHYLFPNPSGILFIDMEGNAKLMVVETEASMMAHYEMAQLQNAPSGMLEAFKTHEVVPFFSNSAGIYDSKLEHQWEEYCLPAKLCRGTQDYYWAIFDFPHHYLDGNIYSYREYLTEIRNSAISHYTANQP